MLSVSVGVHVVRRTEDGGKDEGRGASHTTHKHTQLQELSKSTVINMHWLPTHIHKQQTLPYEDILFVITLPFDGMWKLRKQSALCL